MTKITVDDCITGVVVLNSSFNVQLKYYTFIFNTFHISLCLSFQIRKNSHASVGGLCEGDVVLGINGHPTSGRSHQSAMDVVEMASGSLTIDVAR